MPNIAKQHSFDFIDYMTSEIEWFDSLSPRDKRRNDCGGWTWEPPCGGCHECLMQQATYMLTIPELKEIFAEIARRKSCIDTWENEGGPYV